MREQLTTCHGCGVAVIFPRNGSQRVRWCARCALLANDFNAIEHIAQRYGLPPDTRLDAIVPALQEQLRDGKGSAVDRIAELQRGRAARELAERRRGWVDLIDALMPLVPSLPHRKVEEELFGDLLGPEEHGRYRSQPLCDFARTTFKDDGADPANLLEAAREYLKARLTEDGFAASADPARDRFAWPTMGETRPGTQERK